MRFAFALVAVVASCIVAIIIIIISKQLLFISLQFSLLHQYLSYLVVLGCVEQHYEFETEDEVYI